MSPGLAEGDQGAWPGPGTPAARLMDEGGMHPLLLAALSASDTAAWHTDLVSRERWWSGHMFAMHGLEPGRPVPADYLDLVIPEDRPAVEAAFRSSLQTGSHRVDYRVCWPDGSVHWLEGRGHALRGGNGRTVAISGVCQLIDARKREEADLGFRAQASLELARSVDYEGTLRRIAAMAVPHFADWCAVDMLDGHGMLRRLAVAHTDPGKQGLARTLHEHYPPSPDDPGGVWQVLRSGQAELVAELTDDMLVLSARDERHLALLRSLGLRSYMGVPISGADGGALGVITFVSAESARVYGTRDLDLATDLAARAALAVRNATVFQQLQHSQRRQDFLLRLTDVLRGGGTTAQVLHGVSEMLGRHFGVNRVGYGDVDEYLDRIDYDICWTDGSVAPLQGRFPASAFGPQVIERLRGGQTVVIGDVRDHPLTSELATIQTSHEVDTRAILVVPLFKAGRLRTIVYLNQRPARDWAADEVALMEDVAERTRELIERGRTEDALRASEARWRGLFERMNEGFFVAEAIRDASGRMVDFWFLQANPAFEQLTGVPAASAVGRAVTEAIPGVPRSLIDAYAAVLDGSAPGKFEIHVPVLGDRWYEARPLRLSDDQFSVMFVEITERKQAELALAESARRYRTLFESIDEGFCILQLMFDADGRAVDYRFVELNPAFERQTGLVGAHGRTVRELVPGIEREYIDTYARVAETGQALRFESHAAALERWFDAFAFRVGEPEDARVAVIFTDVTERRRVRQALLERESELLQTQQLARIGSWAWNVDGDHITTSPEFLNILGLPPGSQMPPFAAQRGTVYPEDDWERLSVVVQRAVQFGEPYAIDLRARRDGELIWVMAQGAAVRDEQGRVVALRGSLQDITERKQVEEALREADARKNEFLATLAHELRNPLAPLRNGLMILRRTGAGEPAAVRALELMERQLTQLVRLVDDLLDVSRVSLGKVVMKKSLASLQSVVETALETSRPLVEAAGHHLDLQLPAEPLLLHVDPTRIAQVLSNLLNNAAKYTPSGGRIQLRAALAAPRQLRIEVQDNGLGIPADMLEDVFELFTQVGAALDRSQGGLGIGLSLARRLVELHGGHIHAESAGAGCGSTFVVELPLAEHAVPEPPAPDRDGAGRACGRRILVVDDNVDAAESLQMLLALAGHEVHLAHTGVEALAALSRLTPDLAFLDIGLPDLNGYDVARAARRTEAGARMVLVALTGWGAQSDQRLAREAGMDLHLTKPVDAAELALALAVPPPAPAAVLDPGL